MNPEHKQGWMATFKIFMVLVIATFGWLWGRGFPGVMRFWLPLSIAVICMVSEIVQKKKFELLTLVLYAGMVVLAYGLMTAFAYGSGSWLRPIFGATIQRFIVGFFWALPYVVVAWVNRRGGKAWAILGLHLVTATLYMGVIGGFDLMPAPEQEALTRGILALLPPFMVRWG